MIFLTATAEAGRELQTELNIMMDEGPLAKNQPEASPRAVSQS